MNSCYFLNILGDPGIGKSQLLRAAAIVAPRAVYVCGNTTSAAGLTVSACRDNSSFGLEAGALVLADQVAFSFLSMGCKLFSSSSMV